jgi:hypothetical protein
MNKCRLVHFFLNQLQYLIMGAYYYADLHQKYRSATLLGIKCLILDHPPERVLSVAGLMLSPKLEDLVVNFAPYSSVFYIFHIKKMGTCEMLFNAK